MLSPNEPAAEDLGRKISRLVIAAAAYRTEVLRRIASPAATDGVSDGPFFRRDTTHRAIAGYMLAGAFICLLIVAWTLLSFDRGDF